MRPGKFRNDRNEEAPVSMLSENERALVVAVDYGDDERLNRVERTTFERVLMSLLQRLMCAVNEASTVERAIYVCLEAICSCTRLPVGHAFLVTDRVNAEPRNTWYFDVGHKGLTSIVREEIEKLELTSLAEQVLAERRVVYTQDLSLWLNAAPENDFRVGVGLPIWIGREPVGVIEFFSNTEMKITNALATFMSSVTLQLGSALERMRAEESLRRLSSSLLRTQDSERRRIARELHDSVGQYLAALQMNFGRLHKRSRPDSTNARIIQESRDMVTYCIAEIRTMSHLLHPPLLDELGLDAAVHHYVKGYAERSGILVDVNIDPLMGRLEPDVETAFFRVIQEALTNIHRHSGSRDARIKLGVDETAVFVEISDSGRGLCSLHDTGLGSSSNEAGVGITGMKERLRELNGNFEISSTSRGTLVRATLPL
jgi:signal transduction histidine kinase